MKTSQIANEDSFSKVFGVDSLVFFKLTKDVEKEYGINIPDVQMEILVTIGALAEYLARQKQ